MREIKEEFKRSYLSEDDFYYDNPQTIVNEMDSNINDSVLQNAGDNELLVDTVNEQLNIKINGSLYKVNGLTKIE